MIYSGFFIFVPSKTIRKSLIFTALSRYKRDHNRERAQRQWMKIFKALDDTYNTTTWKNKIKKKDIPFCPYYHLIKFLDLSYFYLLKNVSERPLQ